MIFIRYESWKDYLKFYPVTSAILAINIIMFIILSFDGGSDNTLTLLKYGAITNVEPFASQGWRFITSIFLHGGFHHLFSNSFGILVFAPPLERLLGHFRYAVLYLGSGVIGNLASMWFYQQTNDTYISVGASGAIYGIYGAFLFIALFQRQILDESSRKTLYSILLIGIVFSILVAQINWVAHFGGLIGGFLIYGLMIKLRNNR